MEMEKEVKILNLDDILPNRFQPRIKFNESAILELAESIKEHGVIQPIVVRKISDKYEIIAGERRYKASVLAGKTTIPAIITDLDDKNSAEIALIENVQRQDLTPIEEAISYKKILDMGYLNQSDLADKLGKTQSTIANKLRLLNLAEEVQEALLEQKISERHARSLLKLNEDQQQVMLDRIITERLTVRKTDEEIKKMLESETNEDSNVQKEPELEILDLDLDRNEEQKMNEELNIPKEQIIEPVEEIVTETNTWATPVNPVVDVPVIEPTLANMATPVTPSVAPGFMDVDKIENEAQDIFKPQEDPADLDMLLKSVPKEEPKLESPMAPVTPEVTPNNVVEPVQTQTGKFFNMFNFTDMGPTQTEDLEEKQVNMDFGEPKVKDTFMFNFNPLGSVSSIKEEPQTIPESETISNVEAFNPIVETSTPIQSVETPVVVEPIAETPIVETNSNSFRVEAIAEPTPIAEPLSNVIETPISSSVEQSIPTPTEIPASPLVSESLSTPINSPAEIQPSEPEFEPFNPYALNDDNEFTQDNELNNYRIESESPAPIIQEPAKNMYAVADMRTVINTIRECAKTIENYGFELDLDELDFEDRYEVKLVINKKQ